MNKYFYNLTVIYEEVEKRHRILSITANRWLGDDIIKNKPLPPIFKCESMGNTVFVYSINAEDIRQALEILETVINI